MKSPKVFGIGFHKTATTSLGRALAILGYRVCGPIGVHDPNIAAIALESAIQTARQFDAFRDNPWPILFKELDSAYPGSKFILTTRDVDSWWESILGHFGSKVTPMREWIYGVGCPAGNDRIYRKRYQCHNAEVREYFSRRQEDLCVINMSEGDGWNQLCSFLNCPVPDQPFPHLQRASDRAQG